MFEPMGTCYLTLKRYFLCDNMPFNIVHFSELYALLPQEVKSLDEVNKPDLSLTAKLLKKIIHLQFVITNNL